MLDSELVALRRRLSALSAALQTARSSFLKNGRWDSDADQASLLEALALNAPVSALSYAPRRTPIWRSFMAEVVHDLDIMRVELLRLQDKTMRPTR